MTASLDTTDERLDFCDRARISLVTSTLELWSAMRLGNPRCSAAPGGESNKQMADRLWYSRHEDVDWGHPCETYVIWAGEAPDQERRAEVRFRWVFPTKDHAPAPLVSLSERLYDLCRATNLLSDLLIAMGRGDGRDYQPRDLESTLASLQAVRVLR